MIDFTEKIELQGIKLIYEDEYIIVCVKPVGVESEALADIIGNEHCGGRTVYTVHRLDKPVGGVMVFAKNKAAASKLCSAVSSDGEAEGARFGKLYYAVVGGAVIEDEGELSDLLYHDARSNKTFVVKKERKGVKAAKLRYKVRERCEYKGETVSLLEVALITGRSHQVRVQFGSRRLALWGDGKYGSRINGNIALFAYCLSFEHPKTGEMLCFTELPDNTAPWSLFNSCCKNDNDEV